MTRIRKAGVAVVASTLLLAAPGSALATGGGHDGRWDDHGPRGEHRGHHGAVPKRIAAKLRAAERAIQRAQDHADDNRPDAAVAALAAAKRHLASASKGVARRIAAGNHGGPAAAAALARTQGDVIEGTVAVFDGAPDPVVAAAAATLKAALDGRDALVAAIAALPDHRAYAWALQTIARDATGEAQDIGEALTDDALTDAARTALTAAQAQATATASAAQAAGASGAPHRTRTPRVHRAAGNDLDAASRRDCPPGAGRQDGGPGGDAPGSGAATAA